MYRLNCNVTDEAKEILKAKAKRLNTGMGTIITLWALEDKKTDDALNTSAMYKALEELSRFRPE